MNFKTMLFLLVSLVVGSVCLTSCGSDDDSVEPVITLFSGQDVVLPASSGSGTFSFTATGKWTASVASTTGGITWCTLSLTQGEAGTHDVAFNVAANEGYDDRSVTVTLRCGNDVRSFVVTQKQTDALTLTTDKFELPVEGGEIAVEVKSNIDYRVEISPLCQSWITLSASTRGISTSLLRFDIAPSEEAEKREGEIVISGNGLSETVKVYQAGEHVILLTEDVSTIGSTGGELTVELRSNCDYEVLMPDVDWITPAPATRAMSSHTLRYTIQPNEDYDARQAQIVYRDRNHRAADTLTVVQAQKDAILLSESTKVVPSEGGVLEVLVDANIDFVMSLPGVDWISNSYTRALQSYKWYFQIEPNTDYEERSVQVIFSNPEGSVADTLTIVQEPTYVAFVESEKHYELFAEGGRIGIDISVNAEEVEFMYDDWISYTPPSTRTFYKGTIMFDVTPNDTYESRDGVIIFRAKGGEWCDTVTVKQWMKKMKVDVKEAETLSTLVPDEVKYKLEELVLSGKLGGLDFQYIREICTTGNKLTKLDLANANIVKTDNPYLIIGSWKLWFEEDDVLNTDCFTDSKSLRTLILPNSVVKLVCNNYATTEVTVESVVVGNGTKVLYRAFVGWKNLINVTLPQSLEEIGESSFLGTNISEIELPNNLKVLGVSAFESSKLKQIAIPTSLTSIESSFVNCQELAHVEIPDNITNLTGAFKGCSKLASVKLPSNLDKIDDEAFYGCGFRSMYLECHNNQK